MRLANDFEAAIAFVIIEREQTIRDRWEFRPAQ